MDILKSYTDPSNPGSFSGLSGFLKNNNYKKKDVEKSLLNHETFTLHQPVLHNFPRNRTIVSGIDDTWQADLVDVHQLKYQNSHNNYILTCIDVFSKYAWAIPIKTKTSQSTMGGFEKILKDGRVPRLLYIDGGNEFKGECKKFLDKHRIEIKLTKSKFKASVCERFNRTLKEKMWRAFTFNKNKKYIHILPDLVKSYNNSYHRSIKTTPASVDKTNENKIYENLYADVYNDVVEFKFHVGDYVRISLDKNIFEKGYTPNWSNEVYIVSSVLIKPQPLYTINAIDGEIVDTQFYEQQLQKVLKEEFPYDTFEILSEKNNKLLVKQLNINFSEPYIVDKKEFLK